MKLKILAVLLSGALATAGLMGITCGKGNDNEENTDNGTVDSGNTDGDTDTTGGVESGALIEKGVEVSAEEWASAFTATYNLRNYTARCCEGVNATVIGNYKGNAELPVNVKTDAIAVEYEYFDLDNGVVCSSTVQTDFTSGFSDLDSLEYYDELIQLKMFLSSINNLDTKDVDKTFEWAGYQVKIDDNFYYASNWRGSSWEVENYERYNLIQSLLVMQTATEEGGAEKALSELYSSFVYSDGVYTADLWMNGDVFTVSVSFSGGHVLSLNFAKNRVYEEEGLTITDGGQMGMTIYDVGKTTVMPSPEAVEAIENYLK